jgi:hypothetical protein
MMCRENQLSPVAGTLREVVQDVMYQFTTEDGDKVNVRVYNMLERKKNREELFFKSVYDPTMPNIVLPLACDSYMAAFKSWTSTIHIPMLDRRMQMSLSQVLVAFSNLCKAIVILWERGIVHGSLFPWNIVVHGDEFLMTYFSRCSEFNTRYPFKDAAADVSDG